MTNTVCSPALGRSLALSLQVQPTAPGPVDAERVADLVSQLLAALGEDPARDGLVDTPNRVAAWWSTFLSPDSSTAPTCFIESSLSGQLVVIGGLNVWSLCEHHLLPMRLDVAAGYYPRARWWVCRSSAGSRSGMRAGYRCRSVSRDKSLMTSPHWSRART